MTYIAQGHDAGARRRDRFADIKTWPTPWPGTRLNTEAASHRSTPNRSIKENSSVLTQPIRDRRDAPTRLDDRLR
jgi:hypothetical protein